MRLRTTRSLDSFLPACTRLLSSVPLHHQHRPLPAPGFTLVPRHPRTMSVSDHFRAAVADLVVATGVTPPGLSKEHLLEVIEAPRDTKNGDLALPLPSLKRFVKIEGNPADLAKAIAAKVRFFFGTLVLHNPRNTLTDPVHGTRAVCLPARIRACVCVCVCSYNNTAHVYQRGAVGTASWGFPQLSRQQAADGEARAAPGADCGRQVRL